MKIADMPVDARNPKKHINPETSIWPIAEWGWECMRGFVSDSRFGSDRVIARTNRATTRRWLRSGQKERSI